MAGIGATYMNLVDLYKSKDPDGSIATVIEMLMEANPVMDDAVAVECNNGTSHIHTVRTGLPSVAWGKLYQGIAQSKSTKAQVQDTTGFVEALSTVDKRLLDLSTNANALRLSEAKAFLEAMEQEVTSTFFYGNTASAPNEFMGLSPRFNDLSAPNGGQIIDCGGVGSDNTSLWIVGWGVGRCHLLYPKGTKAGVQREDKGEQRVLDASNNPYYVLEEMFSHHIGVAVADWRYVVRLANIDVSNLRADPTNIDGSNNSLYHFLRKGYYAMHGRRPSNLQTGNAGRTVIYGNKDILEALDALQSNTGANDTFARLRPAEVEGKEVMAYRGMPLRETDALLNTEAQVT